MAAGPQLSTLISRHEISMTVSRLAEEIGRDYEGKSPLVIAVLKGSFIFLADLVREMRIPLTLAFVEAKSYQGVDTTGRPRLTHGIDGRAEGRHVLLVEDIIDTGITADYIIRHINARMRPASLKLCALLDKPTRRRVPVHIDYLGFIVPDRFLVGYGLDLDEHYRHLPDIHVLDEKG